MQTSPPTFSGLSVRVFLKVAVAAPVSVTRLVGWNFQVLFRNSSTTGAVNVTGAPTRTGVLFDSHGTGVPVLAADRKLVLAPSSSVTARAALSAFTAAMPAVSLSPLISV